MSYEQLNRAGRVRYAKDPIFRNRIDAEGRKSEIGEEEKKLVLPLVNFKDKPEILYKPARKVEKFDEELRHFVLRMLMTIRNVSWGNCVGLAANQVGDDRALFIAEGLVYVNPEIIWMTEAPKNRVLEGCYSLEENKNYTVDRAPSITLRWQDLAGMLHEKRFNGFAAQVIQHENDHLLGRLCNEHEQN